MIIGISTSSIEKCNTKVFDGIAHYTEQLIENLERSKYQVVKYAFPRFMKKGEFQNSISLKYSYQLHSSWGLLTKGFFPLNPKVDIFHSTDFRIIPMSCPVIATIWDAIPYINPEWMPSTFKSKLTYWLYKKSAKFADAVIVPSLYSKSKIIEYFGVRDEKIHYIPWALDDKWFSPIDQDFANNTLKKYHLDKGSYILSVGTIQPRKNYNRLIDAFLSLPQDIQKKHNLVIVGKIGWKAEDVLAKIKQHSDKIKLFTNVSDQELRAIYNNACIFVFPSLHEGFGMPILEAFASDIPVIASNSTSVPEVCGEAAIPIDVYSTKDISNTILLLLKDSILRNKLIKLGRSRIKNFTWAQTLSKTLDIYKSLSV